MEQENFIPTGTVKLTPVYDENVEAYESGKYRVIANQGSTRSSKTYSIDQLLALYIPIKYRKSISIVGPSLPHLKRGARRDFLEILENAGIYREERFNKTDNVYHYQNGSYVEFFGVDEPGKVRGPGRDILFVNEANLIPLQVFRQLAMRTNEVIFIDFNPVEESSWVYDVADAPGNKLIHSTYRNNLDNLTDEIIKDIESLRDADEGLWNVFGLGLRGQSKEIVYTHWKLCDSLPGKGETWYGLDFGYNNPSALVKIEYYEGSIYAEEILYQTKLTTNDLATRLLDCGIKRTNEIFCDNAEPKTIEELHRAGFNAKPCDKKEVKEGIRKIKSMPLLITKNSSNMIKEIKSYKWKVDKDERVLDEPVKFNDHAMDAMRYAVFTKLAKPKFVVAVA